MTPNLTNYRKLEMYTLVSTPIKTSIVHQARALISRETVYEKRLKLRYFELKITKINKYYNNLTNLTFMTS